MINVHQQAEGNDDVSFLPDLTTLLDILFILLVFFILTAGAVYRSLDLTLPEGGKEATVSRPANNQIVLEIRPNGYALDGETFASLDALKSTLKIRSQEDQMQNLIIAGDKSTPIERLLPVLTYLQSLGINTANILMKSDTPK
ncbi:ExbD/TolR family protein [Sneathiella glossodoripedis]|uniref:ExbD/TolR family protein n=1 Tax=Sneathiella glossodoripedis TaxID=418853 RepID=UPI00046EAB7A|nr:biopolymer transporter ExbD [Sneathiella glossodoripedis]